MRSLLLALVAAALSGCASTRVVEATDPAALAELTRALYGTRVTVVLATTDPERGRIEFVRPDSTAWRSERARRAVPTGEVRAIVRDTRLRSAATGLGVGVGIGLALRLATSRAGESGTFSGVATEMLFRYLAVPAFGTWGTIIGAAHGRRITYRLE